MADNNNEEKLKITAELDTSKLAGQARAGAEPVKRSFKEIDRAARETEREIYQLTKRIDELLDHTKDKTSDVAQSMSGMFKSIEQINSRSAWRAVGTAKKFLMPVAKEGMASLGIPEEGGNAVGSIVSAGITGARAGLAFGAGGVPAVALITAAAALAKAGYDLQNAAEKQGDAAIKMANAALDKVADYRERLRLEGVLNSHDIPVLVEERDKLEKRLEMQEKALSFREAMTKAGITNTQEAVDVLKSKGMWDKTWDIFTTKAGEDAGNAQGHADSLVELAGSLEDIVTRLNGTRAALGAVNNAINAQNKEFERGVEQIRRQREQAERRKIANEETLNDIRRKVQLNGIEEKVSTFNRGDFDSFMNDLHKQLKEAWDKMNATVGTDAFKANAKNFDFIRVQIETAIKARTKLEKGEAKSLSESIRERESYLDKMSSFRLTDSMVQIGAGGYGAQMQGIGAYNRRIADNVQSMKATLEKCLQSIDEISNKYTPYNGEFI